MSHTSTLTSWSRRNSRQETCKPGRSLGPIPIGASVGPLRVRGLPGFPPRVDADRVARLEAQAARPRDILQLPAVHRPLLGHRPPPAVAPHVQHHRAGADAFRPVLHRPERPPVPRDVLPPLAPTPPPT